MKRIITLVAVFPLLAILGGCVATSSYMTKASVTPQPTANTALVVFMRPSSFGGAIESSVYDVQNGHDQFIGIVSARTKVAYQATPGSHLFMVIAENADFMNANLVAGKTYYVLVSPRMGVWKARFSLLPIHNDASAKYNTKSSDFATWQQDTHFVDTTPAAMAWYQSHAADIATKQAGYMQKWNQTTPEHKAQLTLHADDGL